MDPSDAVVVSSHGRSDDGPVRSPTRRAAPTRAGVLDVIRDRWSPRAFDPDADVDAATLGRMFEAASWAPSANNRQPWSYLVFPRVPRPARELMESCLAPKNLAWAGQASILLLSVVRTLKEESGEPNRTAWHDMGAANYALSLQAVAEGVIVHQMEGFDPDRAVSVFDIRAPWVPATAIAVGYPGVIGDLDERVRVRELRPRIRKPPSEFVFAGRWGTAWQDPSH